MQVQPDSALKILQTLKEKQIPNDKQKALYALLYTQALDKNDLPISNDSLIHIAVDYYSRKKEYRQLGWAWFYLGKTYMQMDSITLAMTFYLKTKELLNRINDDYLLGLVTNEEALLHQEQRNNEQALILLRQSLSAFQRAGNKKNEGLVLSQIGRLLYIKRSKIDSVQYYYDRAKEIAINENDLEFLYYLLSSQAAILRARNEYAQAKQLLLSTIQEYKQGVVPLEWYPLLSTLYLDMQQTDSARHYLQLLLHNSHANIKQRIGALDGLRQIEEQAGNYEAALLYRAKHKVLSDSILKLNHELDIRVLEGKHYLNKMHNENLLQKFQYIITISLILLLAIISLFSIRYWWKKHLIRQKKQSEESLKEFKHSSILKTWDFILFQKEYQSNIFNQTKKEFYTKVIETANLAYPGFIDWIRKCYPQLNNADIALSCLLFSGFEPKALCAPFKALDTGAMYTRCSRLYKKFGLKTEPKDPHSFKNRIIDLYVESKM